ncbi:MAG: hypothetical protein Q9162_001876 [Coniocarpon cinnabarinum]
MAESGEGSLKYADVGINLSDPIFRGVYHGRQVHEDDFNDVIDRARTYGVRKLMVTGSDLNESRRAVDIAKRHSHYCFATVGVHPCSSSIFSSRSPKQVLADIQTILSTAVGAVVAIGEIGLDYDRLHLCPKDAQLAGFAEQLELAASLNPPLPLFLHSRAAAKDFANMIKPHLPQLRRPKAGLVHSFTGTMEEMRELVDLGLDIGVNGCSLKTKENLAVVKEIPLDRLQIETDGPWCEMRPSHASFDYLHPSSGEQLKAQGGENALQRLPEMPRSTKKEKWLKGCMVKGRNEPCTIVLVAHVIAGVKSLGVGEVAAAAWKNSTEMFQLDAT